MGIRSNRRMIACVALAAMLFGALSPAFAAVLFTERPEILGRLLAVPAPAAPAAPQEAAVEDDDGCPHEHHAAPAHTSHENSEHAAHGVFCSFCLNATSAAALPAPPAVVWTVALPPLAFPAAFREQRPAAALALTRHPRDPPSA